MAPTQVEPLVPFPPIPDPRWWQFNLRRARARRQRRVAKMLIRVTLDGKPLLSTTFEQAYMTTVTRVGAHTVGAKWLQILRFKGLNDQVATIELYEPVEGAGWMPDPDRPGHSRRVPLTPMRRTWSFLAYSSGAGVLLWLVLAIQNARWN